MERTIYITPTYLVVIKNLYSTQPGPTSVEEKCAGASGERLLSRRSCRRILPEVLYAEGVARLSP
jgi:hypothetical protein